MDINQSQDVRFTQVSNVVEVEHVSTRSIDDKLEMLICGDLYKCLEANGNEAFLNELIAKLGYNGDASFLSEEIEALLAQLENECVVERAPTNDNAMEDANRPPYVALQAMLEHVLTRYLMEPHLLQEALGLQAGDKVDIAMSIYTPNPTTPLTKPDPRGKDADRGTSPGAFTVLGRGVTLRDFMEAGKGTLVVAYAKEGLSSLEKAPGREADYDIYVNETLKRYALEDGPLYSIELECSKEALLLDNVGAFYTIKINGEPLWGAAIRATQFHAEHNERPWGFWLGKWTEPQLQRHIQNMWGFVTQNMFEADKEHYRRLSLI